MKQLISAILTCILAAGAALAAQSPATDRPTEAVEPKDCVTAECHADIKSAKVLHGPVAASACDACHELTDPAAHTFTIARAGADLCTYCHEFTVTTFPVVHKPVELGECIGCHEPHGGSTRAIVREQSIPELCGRCHESITLGQKHLHTPVADGACDACHSPHASRFSKLVNAAGSDLCLACHDLLDGRLSTAAIVHQALDDGCIACHDVHASNHPSTLLAPPPRLCLSCHEDVQNQVRQVARKHSPVMEDAACTNCHAPHESDAVALMKDQPLAVCMSCHSEDISGYVRGIPEVNDPQMRLHGALADGQCSGCHDAHGGDRALFLVRSMPDRRYQQFSAERYDLCFGCHDHRLAESAQADGLTGFRDGQRNLHFVHANEGDKGRNCRLCHTPHASANVANIRQTVAYGKWQMPIGFESTETGGSCDPGCHVLYRYDRENPVSPDAEPGQDEILPRILPDVVALWSRPDIHGNTVTVPGTDRPTILLFLSAEHPQPQLLQRIASTVATARAQIVVILGGGEAAEQAHTLLSHQAPAWPIVADVQSELTGRYRVRGWPATLVLDSDGNEIGRIRGTPETLPARLNEYLDFAEGRITAAELEQRLRPTGPEEHLARNTERLLAAAQRLLHDGQPEEARKVLDHALKLQPRSIDLQVAMIDTLIALDQGHVAHTMLRRLPMNALPPPQLAILRAKVRICLGQWTEARPLLEAALRENPELAEAHLLMGRVCEQEQNWQQAAQHYRIVHELNGRTR
jgi:predicted CXXCH cytochrome family protein